MANMSENQLPFCCDLQSNRHTTCASVTSRSHRQHTGSSQRKLTGPYDQITTQLYSWAQSLQVLVNEIAFSPLSPQNLQSLTTCRSKQLTSILAHCNDAQRHSVALIWGLWYDLTQPRKWWYSQEMHVDVTSVISPCSSKFKFPVLVSCS